MTRNIKQDWSDFPRRDGCKFLVTVFFFSFFFFFPLNTSFAGNWQETVWNFSSLFCFCFYTFYFFCLFIIGLLRKLARDSLKFLVTILFFFFFCLLLLLSYFNAQDRSKKWQEILSRLGISLNKHFPKNWNFMKCNSSFHLFRSLTKWTSLTPVWRPSNWQYKDCFDNAKLLNWLIVSVGSHIYVKCSTENFMYNTAQDDKKHMY